MVWTGTAVHCFIFYLPILLFLSFFVFVSHLRFQILFTTRNVKETNDNGRNDNRRNLEATESRLIRTKNRAIGNIWIFYFSVIQEQTLLQICDAVYTDTRSTSQFLVAESFICRSFVKSGLGTVRVYFGA